MSVFLLVFIAFLNGEPKGGTDLFATKAECEAQIAPITAILIKNSVQQASVSCVEIKLGNLV